MIDTSLDRMYKYTDNDPCRTYDTKYLRQRNKTIEFQGAPFKTGMMHNQPSQPIIKPHVRPKSKIKSVRLQSVHETSKAVEPSKGKEPSQFTFSNEPLPDTTQVKLEANADLFSPTVTSGFFSPKSDTLVLTQD